MTPFGGWFDRIPLSWVFIGTTALVSAALEIGYRLGRLELRRPNHEHSDAVSVMVAPVLGLLALAVAFTFNVAQNRFDQRRLALMSEINAVGTAYLRAGLLTPAVAADARRLLREYVDVTIALDDGADLQRGIVRRTAIQTALWADATIAGRDEGAMPVSLFIQSVNELINLHNARVALSVRSRIPSSIWIVVYAVAVMSMLLMGYHAGLIGSRRSPAVSALALAFSAMILAIADLDRPHQGLLQTDYQGLEDLRDALKAQ